MVMKIHSSNPRYWNKLTSNEQNYRHLNNDLSNNQISLYEDALKPIYQFYFEQHFFAAEDLFHSKKIWHALSLWVKFAEGVGLIPKVMTLKTLLLTVAHSAFYCLRKIEILKSETDQDGHQYISQTAECLTNPSRFF
jgi:hypothetical protein